MIASNSFWKPRRASVEPASSTVRIATRAAQQAVVMKSAVLTRLTGTPELRAAPASPPLAKIQLPTRVRSRTQVARAAIARNHRTSTGMPSTLGLPLLKVSIQPCSAIQAKRPVKASPRNSPAMGSPSIRSLMPRSWVEPPVAHFSPTRVMPRRMKRKARVTMKEGRPVFRTIWPFRAPKAAATIKVATIARIGGRPTTASATPKISPEKATMEPTERSNSPPIISSAAPIARMPSCDAGDMKVTTPASENIFPLAAKEKKMMIRIRPASAPSSGRRMRRVMKGVCLSLSSPPAVIVVVVMATSRGRPARFSAARLPFP